MLYFSEKLVWRRERDDGEDEYLVKFKGKRYGIILKSCSKFSMHVLIFSSYHKVEWWTRKKIERTGPKAAAVFIIYCMYVIYVTYAMYVYIYIYLQVYLHIST